MRKPLAFIAAAALAALWTLTFQAIYGAHALPARIPTHFDGSGNVNGWGEPRMLWLFPIIATVVFALMALVSRYPESFNYPMRVTPLTRPRLQAITLGMIAWLRFEIVGLFLWIQFEIVRSARRGHNTLPPFLLLMTIGVVFATILAHFVAMGRAAGQMPAAPRIR
ncbi:MAG TPA: DUF1648 domain-containing protein [Terracidiphilus sp.]